MDKEQIMKKKQGIRTQQNRTNQNKENVPNKPYEKFLAYGPEHLTESELLAIILRTGTSNTSAVELAEQVLDLAKPPREGLLGLYDITLEELMKTWMAKLNDNCIFISAREKTNLEELKTVIYNKVRELHVQKYPYNDFLYQTYDEGEME